MWLAGVDGSEEPRLLQVHRGLHFAQDDVVDAVLVSKVGDRSALVFEYAEAYAPKQIVPLGRVAGPGAGLSERRAFLVFLLEAVQ